MSSTEQTPDDAIRFFSDRDAEAKAIARDRHARDERERSRSWLLSHALTSAVRFRLPRVNAHGYPIEEPEDEVFDGFEYERRRTAPEGDPRWGQWADAWILAARLVRENDLTGLIEEVQPSPVRLQGPTGREWEYAATLAQALLEAACKEDRAELVLLLVRTGHAGVGLGYVRSVLKEFADSAVRRREAPWRQLQAAEAEELARQMGVSDADRARRLAQATDAPGAAAGDDSDQSAQPDVEEEELPELPRRPCYERDHTFRRWRMEEGLKVSEIRKRWNEAHPKEPVNRDVVKEGLKKANKEAAEE